jgi:hypothetical protein
VYPAIKYGSADTGIGATDISVSPDTGAEFGGGLMIAFTV